MFKPRKRLWDQSGIKELVTITVPKKVERILTNGLNQDQVQSRLEALANTIDSRGWAVKNVNLNTYSVPNGMEQGSDRLVDASMIPQAVPSDDIKASDDILDERSNPIAAQFQDMITASSQAHRQQLIDEMNSTRQQQAVASAPPAPAAQNGDYWFMNQPDPTQAAAMPVDQAMFSSAVVQPGSPTAAPAGPAMTLTADEAAIVERMKNQGNSQQISYAHLRTIQPLGQQGQPSAQPATAVQNTVAVPVAPNQPMAMPPVVAPPVQAQHASANNSAAKTPAPAMTPQHDPAILSLAHNNDLNISTLAREAGKARGLDEQQDEIVISLH